LFFSLAELGGRHRIAKAKGDELNYFSLLPMRQQCPVFLSLVRWIEEISHEVRYSDLIGWLQEIFEE